MYSCILILDPIFSLREELYKRKKEPSLTFQLYSTKIQITQTFIHTRKMLETIKLSTLIYISRERNYLLYKKLFSTVSKFAKFNPIFNFRKKKKVQFKWISICTTKTSVMEFIISRIWSFILQKWKQLAYA